MAAASAPGPGLIARLDRLHAALGDTQFPQDLRADLHWLLAAYRDALLAVEMAWLDREVVTSMAQELATLAADAQVPAPVERQIHRLYQELQMVGERP